MPLPVVEKNWQFSVNQLIPWTTSRYNTKRMLLMKLKRFMTEVPSNPWTIVRSSDGSAVSNTDRWGTDLSKLNWNYDGSARSWAVFRSITIAASFDFCIDCYDDGGAQGRRIRFCFCPGGYNLTTGTTTTRPSASSGALEYVTDTSDINSIFGGYNTDFNYVMHLMQSSDGKCTRMILCHDSRTLGYFFIDVPSEVIPNSTRWPNGSAIYNYVTTVSDTDTSNYPLREILTLNKFYASNQTRTQFDLGNTNLYLTGEHIAGTNIGALAAPSYPNGPWWQGPGTFSDVLPLPPIGIFSHDLGGARGRVGRMTDLWWGQSGVPTGAQYTNGEGARRFTQFGAMIFPWPDNTAAVLTL